MPTQSSKIILNVCLTGMVPTKELNRYTPITPKEIIKDALACAKLGASIVHIHPRDTDGKPTWKKEIFAKIIYGIREKNKHLIISTTTSGRFWNEFEKRAEVLDLKGDLKPDMASLTVGSMNFIRDESVNSPRMIEQLAGKMRERKIKPEFEVFEPGMVHKANHLLQKGVLNDDKPYFNVFFGSLGTAPLHPAMVSAFTSLLLPSAIWSSAGVGMFQLDANVMGLCFGGHIRVGLEDNLYFDRTKKVLATNETLVRRITGIIRDMQLTVATPNEARKILGIT
ncbi:3-keto-5-aminohexanoate cleavage protein [Candidatus Roizmanbacteria bacterium]|nr:3-keto-5-aminohexanoate cleavage protein [Candidatus Roizmanbacteria bacterium]